MISTTVAMRACSIAWQIWKVEQRSFQTSFAASICGPVPPAGVTKGPACTGVTKRTLFVRVS